MNPQVSTFASFVFALVIAGQVFWIEIAIADCGPLDDNSRTTYRQLQCADFRGPRNANEAAYMRTSIRVSSTGILVETEDEEWVARFASVCVQAFMHKKVSGLRDKECSADSLTHEQHHFDITHHFARSLGWVLEGLEHRAGSKVEAAPGLRELTRTEYADTLTRLKEVNARYDRATLHGALDMSTQRLAALLPTSNSTFIPVTDEEQAVATARWRDGNDDAGISFGPPWRSSVYHPAQPPGFSIP